MFFYVLFTASSCSCADTRSAPYYLKPNETSVAVSLGPPILSCRGNDQAKVKRTKVNLSTKSPQYFNVGQHEVRYKYALENGQEIECVVRFEVKGLYIIIVVTSPWNSPRYSRQLPWAWIPRQIMGFIVSSAKNAKAIPAFMKLPHAVSVRAFLSLSRR